MRYAQKTKRKSIVLLFVKVIAALGIAFLLVYYGLGALLREMYPIRYSEFVSSASAETDLPESLIYAVIKTESGFDPDAESHAGAVGLMQMIPDTFSWIQMKLDGSAEIGEEGLLDPETNIRYGCRVLREMVEMFGNVDTALCAYNAGAGAVEQWLSDPAYSSDGETLDVIPYPETENYVEKVNRSRAVYEKLYTFSIEQEE